MQRVAKLVKRGLSVLVLLTIVLTFFTGEPNIIKQDRPSLLKLDQISPQDSQVNQSPNTNTSSRNSAQTFSASPLIEPPNRGKAGNMTYAGGHVIDGIANVYLIFWQAPSSQPFSPKYISLLRRFVTDIGSSPLYAMLSQYTDSNGRSPTGVRLAGTFLDSHPFPRALINSLNQPTSNSKVMDQTWKQEIKAVAVNQGLNTKSYHNVFAILPNVRSQDACGYHRVLSSGSPYLFISFSDVNGKVFQACNHSHARVFPNNDPFADVAASTLSHELIETATDPLSDGWGSTGNNDEIGDKCNQSPYGLNSITKGNVTWNGHVYLVQREYDNNQHGCTLQGP